MCILVNQAKKKAVYNIRKFNFSRIAFTRNKSPMILTAVAITIFVFIVLFLFTGRIFLEIFQWLLLPFPEKISLKFKKKHV